MKEGYVKVEIVNMGYPPKTIAEYFLRKAQEQGSALTPMQVLKLVYIAHGWQLALNHRPLVDKPVEAWQYGPVIPSLYHHYKRFGGGVIRDIPDTPPSVDPSDGNVMDQVWDGYGSWSGISLSSLTHEAGSPWSTTVRQSGLGAVIPNDLIEDYYARLAVR